MKFNIFRKSIKVESCSERITRHYGASNNVVEKGTSLLILEKLLRKEDQNEKIQFGRCSGQNF